MGKQISAEARAERDAKIAQAYASGLSTHTIAMRFGVTSSKVCKVAADAGVPRRSAMVRKPGRFMASHWPD